MIERTFPGHEKGTAMTPESIPGELVPREISQLLPPVEQLLPPLELVVSEQLDQDPVIVMLRQAA
jgi:hypothetical protein